MPTLDEPSRGGNKMTLGIARGLAALILFALLVGATHAAPPEIAQVYPDVLVTDQRDFPGPRVLVGEGFLSRGLKVWCWDPPREKAIFQQAVATLGEEHPLPATPPEGATRVTPLDVDQRVITANLTGCVVWVRNTEGWSKPCLFDVPRPFWISKPRAMPGELLHMYGHGLQRGSSVQADPPPASIFLQGTGKPIPAPQQHMMPRGPRLKDPHLIYFRVPQDTPPGKYQVWLDNTTKGGLYGFVRAGEIEVVPYKRREERVFPVTEFAAKGDGLTNDFSAVTRAMAAAQAAGGGVVFFPPGTYLVDETLRVPPGVVLRGADAANTVIRGFGYDRRDPQRPSDFPACLVSLSDDTGLERLRLVGAVGKGLATLPQWLGAKNNTAIADIKPGIMVRTDERVDGKGDQNLPPREVPPVRNIHITECVLDAADEAGEDREPLYPVALWSWHSEYLTVNDNDIWGTVTIYHANRAEIVGNTIRRAYLGPEGLVFAGENSLLDSNFFQDEAARFYVYTTQYSCMRMNSMDPKHRGSWVLASESMGFHAWDMTRKVGKVTNGDATSLTDKTGQWTPDFWKETVAKPP